MLKYNDKVQGLAGVIWIGSSPLVHLEYADDIVIMAQSAALLQLLLVRLPYMLEEVGLSINVDKSHVVKFAKDSNLAEQPPILIDGIKIQWVTEVTYLGVKLDSKLNFHTTVLHRMAAAQMSYSKFKWIWRARNISNKFKVQFYTRTIRPSLLYAMHVLPLRDSDIRQLRVCDNRFIQQILRIKWDDFISTQSIHNKFHFYNVSSSLKMFRLCWFGHISRMKRD